MLSYYFNLSCVAQVPVGFSATKRTEQWIITGNPRTRRFSKSPSVVK